MISLYLKNEDGSRGELLPKDQTLKIQSVYAHLRYMAKGDCAIEHSFLEDLGLTVDNYDKLITQFSELADACHLDGNDIYTGGTIEVWYHRDIYANTYEAYARGRGIEQLKKEVPSLVPTTKVALQQTHAQLGTLKDYLQVAGLTDFLGYLQAEDWSPNGEADDMLARLNLKHTSMTFGDVFIIEGVIYMRDRNEFRCLSTPTGATI